MTHATPPDQPTLDDHPGLDNDEATDEGKMMTAEGSGRTDDAEEAPTLEDHPGLDNDEATDEGKMMTAEGSTGAERESTGSTSRKDDPA